MLGRLADVIWWGSLLIGTLVSLYGVRYLIINYDPNTGWIDIIAGLLIIVVGKSAKYIIKGN